jgi:glycosyltransferase involved in cell wall biosynthesis
MKTDPVQRRLRVAVLNRNFTPTGGGAERYSIALVEALAQQHEIHVFAQHIDHDVAGVEFHRIPLPFQRPRWLNQLWFAFATWLETRRGFDVVHSHEMTWWGQVQTVHVVPVRYSLFADRTGLAKVLRWIKVVTSPRLLAYLGLERARFRIKHGDRQVIIPSEALRATMLETYPACGPYLTAITPGVAVVPGLASSLEMKLARKSLGLPDAGHCVLFVANDYRKKGLSALLRAMQSLPPEVYLAVVGNPQQVALVMGEVQQCGLEGRVYFLGALQNVGPAYQASNCLAHPTQEDTFAMVVLEAMAHGLPVVASAPQFCGISALLADEQNALILPDPLNGDALGVQLGRLIFDSALRERLSEGAVRFANEHLWSVSAQRQDAVYQAVVGKAHK